MKSKKGYARGIKIILCILDIFFICFIGYRIYSAFLKNNNDNNNDIGETTEKNIDNSIFEQLITYIPFSIDTVGNYKDAYNGTFVTAMNVSAAILSSVVSGRYNESYTAKNGNTEDIITLLRENNIDRGIVFLNEDINEFLMKRYNISFDSLDNSSDNIKLITLNDKYSAFVTKTVNSTQLNKVPIYYNTYEENDDIIVLEKIVFVVLKNNKYYVYANSDISSDNEPIKMYEYTDDNGKLLDIDVIAQKIKEDLINYASYFKHTFKKNDAGYYWYSTEFVE